MNKYKKSMYTSGERKLLYFILFIFSTISFSIVSLYSNVADLENAILAKYAYIPNKEYSYSVSTNKIFSQAETNRLVTKNNPLYTKCHYNSELIIDNYLEIIKKEYPYVIIGYFRNLFLFFISINAP